MKFLRHKKSSIYLNLLSAFIISLGLIMAYLVYATENKLKYDAKIINETGIIRGGIQRVTKLVLSGSTQNYEKLSASINRLIEKFTAKNGYRFRELDGDFVTVALELKKQWLTLEASLIQYQWTPSEKLHAKIINESEICWKTAVEVVLTAQHVAENNVKNIEKYFYLFLILNIVSAILILFLIFSYVRKKLEYESSHDHLTSLFNRRSYEYAVEYEVARNERYGSPLSLILFDIDHFKIINDTYGHNTGDQVITTLTKLITGSIRKSDLLFRVGGEEFAIISPETNSAAALKLAEAVRNKVEGHVFGAVEKVTISLGVAEYYPGLAKDHLYSNADQAMYQAKNGGRNRTEVFNNSNVKLSE